MKRCIMGCMDFPLWSVRKLLNWIFQYFMSLISSENRQGTALCNEKTNPQATSEDELSLEEIFSFQLGNATM